MKQSGINGSETFEALIVEQDEHGKFISRIGRKRFDELPEHGLLVKVNYSGLNYKDALSASGHKGITRKYPHTPGIDAAGVVVHSDTDRFRSGDEVIVTGYDLGMNTSGGLAAYICVPPEWAVRKPDNLTLQECMAIGTSGFTAASAIFEFINHGTDPEKSRVLVSGASGAVGSMAVAMLSKAGFMVTASTGKPEAAEFLHRIGASEIIGREDLNDTSGKGLLPVRWHAALDTVGGNTLSTVLLSTAERGIVANCGMIASSKLEVPVFPFILRAVRLTGIAAAETPMERRLELWNLISNTLKPDCLDEMIRIVPLHDVPSALSAMINGSLQGKIVVRITA